MKFFVCLASTYNAIEKPTLTDARKQQRQQGGADLLEDRAGSFHIGDFTAELSARRVVIATHLAYRPSR